MKRIIPVSIALFVLATAAAATDVPSVERGSKLFSGTQLGTNGRSCAGCHPDGKGLEDAADHNEETLAETANRCIVKALKGKALAVDSVALTSLVMYMKTLGTTKEQ